MDMIIAFVLGLFLGGFLGVLTAALAIAGRDEEDEP